jgi:hypothetical protein
MFRASCPSSGKEYKADNAYGVQQWPCCSRLEEERWFGVHLLGNHWLKPIPTSAHQPPLLHESSAARPVLFTIGVVGFVPFS